MALTEITLKEAYDSDEDHILNDFYIPVLSHSVRYDRLAGYFSSTSLASSAKGMAQFLRNGGRMRLVTSVQISAEDQQAIKKGLATPEAVIGRMMASDLDDLTDRIKNDYVGALAWMLAKDTLEIKVVVPLSSDGSFHTKTLDYNSIYHQKIGILQDVLGNLVSFSGSINETGKGWNENVEEFKVFCSWKIGQNKYGSRDMERFEKFWSGQSSRAKVFDLPTAIREKLIQSAPKTEEEAVRKLDKKNQPPTLWPHQIDAREEWLANGRRGILEMATGTGKTRSAISCIVQMRDKLDLQPMLVVIACPYIHLVSQWARELEGSGIKSRKAYGSAASWQADIANHIIKLRGGIIDNLVIVTTHDTFSSKKFIEQIRQCNVNSLVVADEVHRLGAERRSEGLLALYANRLGLSATPERYFDDGGTKKILKYFGDVVYKFGIDDAIRQGYLAHYMLFPHAIYLTDEEMEVYNSRSRQIAIEYAKENPDYELLKTLILKRSQIVRDAQGKIDKFKDIIESMDSLDHCLVYCSDQQIDIVASVLYQRGIKYHKFTYKEDLKMRDVLLEEFARGDVDVLVAMKCLDEGVDVPSTKTAIILASSRNPAEFVQRRGRVLRIDNDKNRAVIHDVLALPPISTNRVYTEMEKKVMVKEVDRLGEFAMSADNPEHSREFMRELDAKYELGMRV